MGVETEGSGGRRAGRSVASRRNGYAGAVAATVFTFVYSVIFVIPNPSRWYAIMIGQAGLGLFLTVVLAAISIPPAWAAVYLILKGLGIPIIEGDGKLADGEPVGR